MATTTKTATSSASAARAGRAGVTEHAAGAAVDQACRMLRLPTMRARFAEVADAAQREQLTYRGFLAELLMAECDDRDRRRSARRITAAGFPREKWLQDFDYNANPHIQPAVIAQLAACAWLSRYGYGLLLPQMRASLGLGLGTLGVIGAGSYASYLAASLAAPRLVARWGLRVTVVLGGLAAAGGMLLCAAATGAVSLGAGIALAGASAALVWPPYIAAVETHLAVGRRPGAHGLINSGTAYGVAVAGPLSLLAGSSWRTAWIVFAGLAVAVTAWCALVLGPHRPPAQADQRGARLWPVARRQGAGLLATAGLLGLVAGCYWTFGVEAATAAAPVGSSSGAVFQLVVGLSGVTGGAVGALLTRATLPRFLALMALALGAACLLLTTGPAWLVLLSAALYGAAFIAAIGLLVIWNTQVVPEAAATGVATSMFAMGTGLIIGPPLAGATAATWGIDAVFLACVPLCAAIAVLVRRPGATAT